MWILLHRRSQHLLNRVDSDLNMWDTKHRVEGRITALDLSVVSVYEILDDLKRTIFKFCRLSRQDLANLHNEVVFEVLIPDLLEQLAGHFDPLEAVAVNEVTKLTSRASDRAVEVATRNRAIVARFDQNA